MRDENPASVVRTPRDERLWRMAKASAARQGRAGDWAYVMGIFQHMKHRTGSEPVGNPDEDDERPTMDEARAARLARSMALEIPPEPDYAAIAAQVERAAIAARAAREQQQQDVAPEFQLSASRVQQGLFAESAYEAKAKKPKKQPPADTRQVDMFGLPIDPPKKNPLTDLEADLSPEELAAFESMILRRYDYSIQSFPNVTPREARLALLFREALRDQVGDYGWRAVKAVPAEHVSGTLPFGTLALIFEDVSQDADAVQFSDGWREIEQVTGASLQSYNSWSAYVTDNARRENPASVTDITGRIAARRRERRTAALASMYATMAADPGFQQAARRRRAEETMQQYAAGPQLFKRGDRVTYAGTDGAIPASWRGRVAVYEWHPEWSDDSDGHFYTVRWTTPEGATHEGVHHQSDLR